MKWEYLTANLDNAQIQILGREGWEAVAVFSSGAHYCVLFKRPLKE